LFYHRKGLEEKKKGENGSAGKAAVGVVGVVEVPPSLPASKSIERQRGEKL